MAKQLHYKVVSLADIYPLLDPTTPIAFDTETAGLYGKVALAQFYQPSWASVMLVQWPNMLELAALLNAPNYSWIMQNGSYDLSTLQDNLGLSIWPNFIDTLYLARLFYLTKQEFSLDKIIEYVIGYDVYEEYGVDKKAMQGLSWTQLPSHDQLVYASLDVFYLHQVVEHCKDQLDSFSYKLDMLTCKYFLQNLQPTGLPVDREKLERHLAKNLDAIKLIDLPINSNSYVQVREYLNTTESDDLALAKLIIKNSPVRDKAIAVRTTRKLLKENSFIAKYTGERIYGKFSPSTRSGRSACKDQNLQQLPRSTKGLFGFSTDSDRCLIFSDFAQLELRCAAVAVPEHLMVKLMREGVDMHSYVAERIFGVSFTKQHRQIAKTCNFNLLYGGSAAMLQTILLSDADIWLEIEEVINIRNTWMNLFSGFASWHERGIIAWRSKKPWATPSGRGYVGKLMTDQVNIMIQGMGAEVAKLALHYMLKDGWFKANDINLANFVHDSYIFDCPRDSALYSEASKRIADAMSLAWKEISAQCTIKDLPMPVQVLVGFNWGAIEKGDYFYEYKC